MAKGRPTRQVRPRFYSLGNMGQPIHRRILRLFARLCLLPLFVSILSGTAWDHNRVVIVGANNNYPPYEFVDENGVPVGYNIDLIHAVAREMGLKVRIVAGKWGDIRKGLDTGDVDVLSGMFYSPERAKVVDFSIPSSILTYSIFARKGETQIRGPNDLAGHKVLAEEADLASDLLASKGIPPILAPDSQHVIQKLSAGEADAAVIGKVVGLYAIKKGGIRNVEIVGSPFHQQDYCFAVKHNREDVLLQKLNEGLTILKYSGEQQRIAKKWLSPWDRSGVDLQKVLTVVSMLLGLLLLAFAWSWTLRKQVRERTKSLQNELAERRRAEQRILKLNRLYAVTTQINKSIVRHQDRDILFDEVCRLCHEFGEFSLVWIGVIDEVNHRVIPAAHAADGPKDYLNNIHISTLEELPEGRGPGGVAAREGRLCISQDVATDPCMAPWRSMALAHNCRSCAALPLKVDGKPVAVLAMYASEPHFFDDEEELALLDGVASDISFALEVLDREKRRERAELALHESEERFRTAFQQAAIGMALSDTNTIQDVNASLCEMLGYTRQELIGMQLATPPLTPEEEVESSRKIIRKLTSGEAFRASWEKRYIHKDGHPVWAQVVSSVVRDSAGYPIQFITQIQDITARKRAEAELLETHATLQAAFRASPIAIVSLDLKGNVLHWNRASEQLFGWSAEEVLGRPYPLAPPEDKRGAEEGLKQAVERGEGFFNREMRRRRKDGSLVDVSMSAAPFKNAEGQMIGAMLAYADLTERKRLEAQLLQSQKLESVGRLAGGVAHDFNNLLTVINCYCDILLTQSQLQDQVYEAVREIRKAGDQASNVTRQLLTFSRRQIAQFTPLDVNAIVEDMQGMLQRLIGEDVQLEVLLSKELGKVKADRGQLQQVIMNLVVNARDAMPNGGKLLIETSSINLDGGRSGWQTDLKSGPHVLLSVSDTGFGMDEETQRRIFEPFFTTKDQGEGTGLGLSTVWGIVKQNGGHVWVYSEVDKGTTFKVYLPRISQEEALTESPPEEKPVVARGNETVLLVEDQPQLRELTSKILKDYGYTVIEAAEGTEALHLCSRVGGTIHIVLTDIVMPGLTGIELGRRLRQIRPETKILYMSGYTDEVILRQGPLEPGSGYLEKPFTPEGLAAKIRQVLGTSDASKETAA